MQDDTWILPVMEERLHVGKRSVLTARVRVETTTEEVEETVSVPLSTDTVDVVRVPVGREVAEAPAVRVEGDTTIIPVLEEELVVTRRLVLKEEIHITQRRSSRVAELPVTRRQQRVVTSREPVTRSQEDENMADDHSTRSLSAFFDHRSDADSAAERLRALGVSESEIRITGGDEVAGRDPGTYQDKGFWDSIADFFFPSDERDTYAEGLRRGGYLLTVSHLSPELHDAALDILDAEGSVDLEERSSSWRAEGWEAENRTSSAAAGSAAATTGLGITGSREAPLTDSRPEPLADPLAGDRAANAESRNLMADDATALGVSTTTASGTTATGSAYADERDEVIPVIEENLRVGKRDVNLGRVRVRSYVTERPVSADVTLREEHVEIERRPVDRALTGDEAPFQDRVLEAEEHAEEAVVAKEARVTEEISLRRHAEERKETISDTVRQTEVEVEDEREGLSRRNPTPQNP